MKRIERELKKYDEFRFEEKEKLKFELIALSIICTTVVSAFALIALLLNCLNNT